MPSSPHLSHRQIPHPPYSSRQTQSSLKVPRPSVSSSQSRPPLLNAKPYSGSLESTRGRTLNYEDLARYFHLPINTAARELGVCVTALKKQCRKHGVPRWPHRKLKSLDKLKEKLEKEEATAADKEYYKHEIHSIVQKKDHIFRASPSARESSTEADHSEQPNQVPTAIMNDPRLHSTARLSHPIHSHPLPSIHPCSTPGIMPNAMTIHRPGLPPHAPHSQQVLPPQHIAAIPMAPPHVSFCGLVGCDCYLNGGVSSQGYHPPLSTRPPLSASNSSLIPPNAPMNAPTAMAANHGAFYNPAHAQYPYASHIPYPHQAPFHSMVQVNLMEQHGYPHHAGVAAPGQVAPNITQSTQPMGKLPLSHSSNIPGGPTPHSTSSGPMVNGTAGGYEHYANGQGGGIGPSQHGGGGFYGGFAGSSKNAIGVEGMVSGNGGVNANGTGMAPHYWSDIGHGANGSNLVTMYNQTTHHHHHHGSESMTNGHGIGMDATTSSGTNDSEVRVESEGNGRKVEGGGGGCGTNGNGLGYKVEANGKRIVEAVGSGGVGIVVGAQNGKVGVGEKMNGRFNKIQRDGNGGRHGDVGSNGVMMKKEFGVQRIGNGNRTGTERAKVVGVENTARKKEERGKNCVKGAGQEGSNGANGIVGSTKTGRVRHNIDGNTNGVNRGEEMNRIGKIGEKKSLQQKGGNVEGKSGDGNGGRVEKGGNGVEVKENGGKSGNKRGRKCGGGEGNGKAWGRNYIGAGNTGVPVILHGDREVAAGTREITPPSEREESAEEGSGSGSGTGTGTGSGTGSGSGSGEGEEKEDMGTVRVRKRMDGANNGVAVGKRRKIGGWRPEDGGSSVSARARKYENVVHGCVSVGCGQWSVDRNLRVLLSIGSKNLLGIAGVGCVGRVVGENDGGLRGRYLEGLKGERVEWVIENGGKKYLMVLGPFKRRSGGGVEGVAGLIVEVGGGGRGFL